MGEEPKIAALDVAELDRWLNDPDASIGELMADLPFLRTEAEARRYLDEIREALDDVKHGRVVPHEQIVRDAAERRRRYRASAAE
jgi:hypothetical protein